MALFGKKRSRKLPEGWIERGDQVMIPVDEVTPEFAEGEHTFRILDEWNGDIGPFVGVNATAVREAAESSGDPRAAAEEAMNNPANWVDEDVPDGLEILVCRVDISNGTLDVGPAMTDLMLGTAEFQAFEIEGSPSICINVKTVQEESVRRVEERDFQVTEDEHRALTHEIMDDPAYWMREGEVDSVPEEADDEEPEWSFFRLDYTTGRIDRR